MQNAEPSTSVTTPSTPPIVALALVVHGSGIAATATASALTAVLAGSAGH